MLGKCMLQCLKEQKKNPDISGFDLIIIDLKHIISVGLDSEHTGLIPQSRDVHI